MRCRNWSLRSAALTLALILVAAQMPWAFAADAPRSHAIGQSFPGGSYGFCAASVRALYVRAAAMVVAAQAQSATSIPPTVSVPDVAPPTVSPPATPQPETDRV